MNLLALSCALEQINDHGLTSSFVLGERAPFNSSIRNFHSLAWLIPVTACFGGCNGTVLRTPPT